jgi:hypothetical protein
LLFRARGVRHNAILKAFYEQLRLNGKPAKVALTASCANSPSCSTASAKPPSLSLFREHRCWRLVREHLSSYDERLHLLDFFAETQSNLKSGRCNVAHPLIRLDVDQAETN